MWLEVCCGRLAYYSRTQALRPPRCAARWSCFLTAQGVPGIQASGRFRPLDDRIKEWKKGDANRSQVADLLLAVKWIGNKGTHEDSELALVEVLEGAALLDEAFHRTYAGPDLDAKARSVIEKHREELERQLPRGFGRR